jgi:putative transposase
MAVLGMPRRARIFAAGFPMQVILHGIDWTAIFLAADEFRVFSATLAALPKRESERVHAYREKQGKRGQAYFLLRLRPMPRCTRIHIDGLPPHIVQRGHNRAAWFFDDQDRRAYLG